MKKFFLFLMTCMLSATGMLAQEVDVTTLPWVNNGQGCTTDFNNPNGGTVFGTDVNPAEVANISYVDISAYGQVNLYGPAGQQARLFVNRQELGDKGIFFVTLNEEGVAVFDCNKVLEQMPKAQYIHLNGVKASAWNTHLELSQITVSGDPVELYTLPTNVITCKRGDEVDPRTAPWYTRPDASSDYSQVTYAGEYNIDTNTAAYFGVMWSGENLNNYADLSGYKAIRVYQANSGNLPRAFFVNEAGNTHTQVLGFEWNAAFGYYELDLQKAMDAMGNCKLTTLRATGNSTCTGVSLVTKEKEIDYFLSGTGELTEAAQYALADANACVYDATDITATGVALTTANPNAIIIAKEGTIANDHNVLVRGVINKLQLTDGYPLVLPREASAASAGSYTRTVTTAYSTACLPLCFEFTGEGVYQFVGMDGDVINFRELEGDMKDMKGSYPWLLVGTGEINMYDGGQIYHDWTFEYDTFTGTYAGKTLTSDANKTYYGIKDGAIVKVGENVTVAPFRAYFQLDATSEAKSLKMNLGEETAINSVVEGLNSARAFYNAAGVRQNGLQKGLNIVEMSNGATRKIMIK